MSEHGKMGHIQPTGRYLMVFVGLLVLTAITVWASRTNWSETTGIAAMNDIIALGIASAKASLVILFFMHGKYEGKLIWAFIWYPLILLATLLSALFLDYGTRNPDDFLYEPPSIAGLAEGHGGGHGAAGDHSNSGDHGDAGDHGDTANHGDAADHGDTADHGDATQDAQGDAANHGNTTDETHGDTADHGDTTAASDDEPAADAGTQDDAASTADVWANIPGDAAAGERKAKQLCIACHVIGGVGNKLPTAPAFEESMALDRITPEYLQRWIKNPQEVKPGTAMPPLGLSDQEIDDVIAFLKTYKK